MADIPKKKRQLIICYIFFFKLVTGGSDIHQYVRCVLFNLFLENEMLLLHKAQKFWCRFKSGLCLDSVPSLYPRNCSLSLSLFLSNEKTLFNKPAQHLTRGQKCQSPCTQALSESFRVIVKTHKSKWGSTTSGNYKRVGLDVEGDHTVSKWTNLQSVYTKGLFSWPYGQTWAKLS